ncbi:phosphoribosyltransferase-like protein [Pseudomonas chlororaphis]|uniref:phosphoribosyltransferase-like protein n=1 Tax=Pseudomonas chlororaphis TaxID=587753 RepID=UPI00131A5F47|nr:hypothetical protein [Pseudomonas chlororaphis]
MKKEHLNFVLDILRNQPWLGEKTEELKHILYSECPCDASRNLVSELVNRFLYISREKNYELLTSLAQEIVSEYSTREKTTLIAALGVSSGVDSSQYVAYSLKPLLAQKKFRDHILINDSSAAYRKGKATGHNQIVLVDEFVGSGQTVISQVKSIRAQFKGNSESDHTISVKVLVSTEAGIKNVVDAGIPITAQKIIKKGIDDYYPSKDATNLKDLMRTIEGNLSKDYNGRAMPSLGYNEAQATYYRQDGNTPNSVFPIFWWAFDKNGLDRSVLIIRAMGDA